MADQTLASFVVKLRHQVDDASAKKFSDSLKSTFTEINAARLAILGFAVGVEETVRRTVGFFNQLGLASQNTGVAAAAIRNIGYAFEDIGLSAGQAQGDLNGLAETLRRPWDSSRLVALVGPVKDAGDAFNKLAEKYHDAISQFGEDSPQARQLDQIMHSIPGVNVEDVERVGRFWDTYQQGLQRSAQIQKDYGLDSQKSIDDARKITMDWHELLERIGAFLQSVVVQNFDLIESTIKAITDYLKDPETIKAFNGIVKAIHDFVSDKDNLESIKQGFISIGQAITGSVKGITWLIQKLDELDKKMKPFNDFMMNPFGGDPNKPAPGFENSPLMHGYKKVIGAITNVLPKVPENAYEYSGAPSGYLRGGIVPSFQHGGILSRLHAGEMVLPTNISQGMQSLFSGAAGGLVDNSKKMLQSFLSWFAGDSSMKPQVDLSDDTLAKMGYTPKTAGDVPTTTTGGAYPGVGGGGGGGGGGDGGGGGGGYSGGAPSGKMSGSEAGLAHQYYDYLTKPKDQGGLGLDDAHAKGLLANVYTESRFNPQALGDKGTSFGLVQWHADRWAKMKEALGKDINNPFAQLKYALEEQGEQGGIQKFLQMKGSPEQLTDAWQKLIERPKIQTPGSRYGYLGTVQKYLSQQAPADAVAPTGGGGGFGGGQGPMSPEGAVDQALSMQGMHEQRDRQSLIKFMKAGGVNLDPAVSAWCAAYVNANLKLHGVKGTGSQLASSFAGWGKGVNPKDVMKGDVLLLPPHGQSSGHVGQATGGVQWKNGREFIEMIAGNTSDQVKKEWIAAEKFRAIRRATEDMYQRPLGADSKVASNRNINSNHQVTINVHGENAKAVADQVAAVQDRHSAMHTRNLRPIAV